MSGSLEPETVDAAAKAMGLTTESATSALADAVWYWSNDCLEADRSLQGQEDTSMSRLVRAVRALMSAGLLDKQCLLETQDPHFLEAAGFVTSKETWSNQKERRYYTRAIFAQERYTLLREASEGYVRLLELLYNAVKLPSTADNVCVKDAGWASRRALRFRRLYCPCRWRRCSGA